jgi:hypothetical protein
MGGTDIKPIIMRRIFLLFSVILFSLASCSRRNTTRTVREDAAFQFAVDRISTPYIKGGGHLDSLLKHFDIPLDSERIRIIWQGFIPWGKLRPESISLKQIVSMHLKDGKHYYMVIFLDRSQELRCFKYLVEVFDNGKELWLRQFSMFDTSEAMLSNVWIEKREDRAIWMVKNSKGKCEWDGKSLTYHNKIPFHKLLFNGGDLNKLMEEEIEKEGPK